MFGTPHATLTPLTPAPRLAGPRKSAGRDPEREGVVLPPDTAAAVLLIQLITSARAHLARVAADGELGEDSSGWFASFA